MMIYAFLKLLNFFSDDSNCQQFSIQWYFKKINKICSGKGDILTANEKVTAF